MTVPRPSSKSPHRSKKAIAVSKAPLSPVEYISRGIKCPNQVLLFTRAGGRCEFDGCNKYLLAHHLTHHAGNFAEMAHIVAFKKNGPRGSIGQRPDDINNAGNLMLLCPPCHKLIDDHPGEYTRETLEHYKNVHEDRIRFLTESTPDRRTTVVQLKAKIAGQVVAIPAPAVREAVSPRYPDDPRGYIIDLTTIDAEGNAFIQAAKQTIDRRVDHLYQPGMEVEATRHISLFALAPIPLLVYFGSKLSNKLPVDAYQRHRDTGDWVWKKDGELVGHTIRQVRVGKDSLKAALVLSLSGVIHLDNLPPEIDEQFSIYEITTASGTPNPNYLRLEQDLKNFQEVYQHTLRLIGHNHPGIGELHVFPAVPAPIAVSCGLELLPKVDPALLIYDYDKNHNGFKLILGVNQV